MYLDISVNHFIGSRSKRFLRGIVSFEKRIFVSVTHADLVSELTFKTKLLLTYRHYTEAYLRLPQTSKMESFAKIVDHCHKEHPLRSCSTLRSASGAKPIIILHPIVEKWSVPSYAAREKLKLPRLSAMMQSNTKTTTSKNVIPSSQTGQTWLTCASKSKYRPCKSFTLFH